MDKVGLLREVLEGHEWWQVVTHPRPEGIGPRRFLRYSARNKAFLFSRPSADGSWQESSLPADLIRGEGNLSFTGTASPSPAAGSFITGRSRRKELNDRT